MGSTVVGSSVVGATVVGSAVVGATVVGSTVVGTSVVGATVVGLVVVGATVVGSTVVGLTGFPSFDVIDTSYEMYDKSLKYSYWSLIPSLSLIRGKLRSLTLASFITSYITDMIF